MHVNTIADQATEQLFWDGSWLSRYRPATTACARPAFGAGAPARTRGLCPCPSSLSPPLLSLSTELSRPLALFPMFFRAVAPRLQRLASFLQHSTFQRIVQRWLAHAPGPCHLNSNGGGAPRPSQTSQKAAAALFLTAVACLRRPCMLFFLGPIASGQKAQRSRRLLQENASDARRGMGVLAPAFAEETV